MAGYSPKPLAQKLGLKPGQRAWWEGMPESVADEIGDPGLDLLDTPDPPIDAAHIFVTDKAKLVEALAFFRTRIAPAGFLWVSWPKKAAKVATDVSENGIRDSALPMGWVDVKVCAIDATWSGLKLVIRKGLR